MFDNLSFLTSIFVRFVLFFVFRFRCFFIFYALLFCFFNLSLYVYCYWIGLWYLSRTRRRTPGWGIHHAFWNSYPTLHTKTCDFTFPDICMVAIWNSNCCSVFLQSQLKVVKISNIVFVKWNKILSMRKMSYWEKAESITYLVLAN